MKILNQVKVFSWRCEIILLMKLNSDFLGFFVFSCVLNHYFIFSKTGHSPVLQPEELQGRTSIRVDQVSKNLKIEGKPGKSSSIDALVIEVKI